MYMLIKYEVNGFSKTQNFTRCLKVGKQLIILKGCMHEKKKNNFIVQKWPRFYIFITFGAWKWIWKKQKLRYLPFVV